MSFKAILKIMYIIKKFKYLSLFFYDVNLLRSFLLFAFKLELFFHFLG